MEALLPRPKGVNELDLNATENSHHSCSCLDLFALEARTGRLESVMRDILQALTTSDDMLLLEREGAKCFIAQDGLVNERPAKLLRTHLLKIISQHGL